jgi:CHRD domain-containing protein
MRRLPIKAILLLTTLATLGLGSYAMAGGDESEFRARLSGYQETPLSLSSPGFGSLRLDIDRGAQAIRFRLKYGGTPTAAGAAHIHLGARATTGGVAAFLCGGGGKPPCPPAGGTVTGTITPADVIGPASQGIDPGEFGELIRAIRAGATYANVHTTQYPGGEIRGQIQKD